MRWLHHLFLDHLALSSAFPKSVLAAIGRAVVEQERRHRGELRVVIEGGLPIQALLLGRTARQRAEQLFVRYGVGNTKEASGVLIYLLLADRRVEILADRGIHERVGETAWEAICGEMQRRFAAGNYEEGVVAGLTAASDLLAQHFPADGAAANPNELPDAPATL